MSRIAGVYGRSIRRRFASAAKRRGTSPSPRMPPNDSLAAPSHQVAVHDPSIRPPRVRPHSFDIVDHIPEFAGQQNLVRHADIGTPIDIDILVREPLVGIFGIE